MSYQTYQDYKDEISKILIEISGKSIDDYPEWDWKEAWRTETPYDRAIEYFLEDMEEIVEDSDAATKCVCPECLANVDKGD